MKASPEKTKARLQFLTWLNATHPKVYDAAVTRANHATLGAAEGETETPWWQKAVTGVIAAGTAYLGLKGQRDVLKLNLQRVEQGLPPVDPATMTSAPVVRTQVDLPPEIIQRVTESAGDNINKVLMVGGGLGLLALLMMSKKR